MIEQGAGLMPAGHDRAPFGFEQRQRGAGLDRFLKNDAAAAGQCRQRAEHEPAAPEQRQVAPPGVVPGYAEALGDTARGGRESGVVVDDGFGLRGAAR